MLRDLRRALRRDQHEAQTAVPLWPGSGTTPRTPVAPLSPTPSGPLGAAAVYRDPAHLAAAVARARAALPRFGDSLARLDPWQQQAVVGDDSAAVVRAHVGSGKTAVLAHRVLWWHLVHGIPLSAMAIATFTTKAAAELSARISALLDTPPPPRAFWLTGTLHGLARTLLEAGLPHHGEGLKKGFGVLDEAARQALLLQLAKDHALHLKYRNQLAARVRDFQRGGPVQRGVMRGDDDLATLAALYQQAKQARNVLDFDDLIGEATRLARQGPVVPLRTLVIDELQDCAPDEVALLRALALPGVAFFAVGDPNQSIYTWRGTDPQVFDTLTRAVAATTYDLPRNYRSTPEILAAASGVLGQQASGAALQPTRAGGAPVHIRRHHDPHLEGLYLCGRLHQLHEQGVAWHELAVLTRTRRQLEQLRQVLVQQQVPCSELPPQGWADWPMAHWWLQLLVAIGEDDAEAVRAALVRPEVDLLTARWLGRTQLAKHLAPSRGGVRGRRAAENAAVATGATATDVAIGPAGRPTRVAQLVTLLQQRAADPRCGEGRRAMLLAADLLDGLMDFARLGSCDADAETVWQQLRLDQRLRPTHRDHAEDATHLRATLQQLLEMQQDRQRGWADAAAELLRGAPSRDTGHTAHDSVRLLTLHASKGLEFRHVFVSGCNQGVMPLASAWGDPAAMAEERRLLFVGLTRARDSLEVSWHTRPALPQALAIPSDWLLAIPAAACSWEEPVRCGDGTAPTLPLQATVKPTTTEPAVAHSGAEQAAFLPGQRVQHPKYGTGTVTACDVAEVQVDFGKLGARSFSLLLCPLRPL